MPEHSAANTHVGSWKVLAEVDVARADAQGVVFAQGSRFGGHSLFLKDGKLHYVYNFLGVGEERTWTADVPAPGRHIFGIDFAREGVDDEHQPIGTTTLYVDDRQVAKGPHAGHGDPVLALRRGPLHRLRRRRRRQPAVRTDVPVLRRRDHPGVFNVTEEAYLDAEARLAALMARD